MRCLRPVAATRTSWPGGFVGAVASAPSLAQSPASRGRGPVGRASDRPSWPQRRLAWHACGPRAGAAIAHCAGRLVDHPQGLRGRRLLRAAVMCLVTPGRLGAVAGGARSRRAPSRTRRPGPADAWRGGARRVWGHDPRRRRRGGARGGTGQPRVGVRLTPRPWPSRPRRQGWGLLRDQQTPQGVCTALHAPLGPAARATLAWWAGSG
jgi:hypothetical protein